MHQGHLNPMDGLGLPPRSRGLPILELYDDGRGNNYISALNFQVLFRGNAVIWKIRKRIKVFYA